MAHVNIEIKARSARLESIRTYLLENGADFRGTDRQTDTYFQVPHGRLKLREGNIENSLIHYLRPDQAGPKQSDFRLIEIAESRLLKEILTDALGIKVVIKKQREIYYLENIKFHLDSVERLGNFVEIEASDKSWPLPLETLYEQCNFYKSAFQIKEEDLVHFSYSDMLLALSASPAPADL